MPTPGQITAASAIAAALALGWLALRPPPADLGRFFFHNETLFYHRGPALHYWDQTARTWQRFQPPPAD